MCKWLLLPALDDDKVGLCDKPGFPYCDEHQKEMEYIDLLDEEWKEVQATQCDQER
jgi:hypothetical protein